jgi:diacylglycerol kinase
MIVIAAGFYYNIGEGEWLAIMLAIGLVISLELMNTAMEHLVDLVSPAYHEKAGRVKDIAAGAVLVASAAAGVVGVMIFWKYLFGM